MEKLSKGRKILQRIDFYLWELRSEIKNLPDLEIQKKLKKIYDNLRRYINELRSEV
jgi:hypothetical protein